MMFALICEQLESGVHALLENDAHRCFMSGVVQQRPNAVIDIYVYICICNCMCVCMYIYSYIYVCLHMYLYIHIYVYRYIYVCIYIYVHICIYICVSVNALKFVLSVKIFTLVLSFSLTLSPPFSFSLSFSHFVGFSRFLFCLSQPQSSTTVLIETRRILATYFNTLQPQLHTSECPILIMYYTKSLRRIAFLRRIATHCNSSFTLQNVLYSNALYK